MVVNVLVHYVITYKISMNEKDLSIVVYIFANLTTKSERKK